MPTTSSIPSPTHGGANASSASSPLTLALFVPQKSTPSALLWMLNTCTLFRSRPTWIRRPSTHSSTDGLPSSPRRRPPPATNSAAP